MKPKATRNRIIVFLIFVTIVFTLVGGAWFYQNQKENLREKAAEQLHAIARLKTQEIANWRNERLGDANVLTKNPLISQAVARWIESPQGVHKEQFDRIFQPYCYSYYYDNIMVVNEDGGVYLTLVEKEGTKNGPCFESVKVVFHSKQPVLVPIHRDEDSGNTHFSILAPILKDSTDENSPVIAVVVLVMNAEKYLFPLIQTWPASSKTAETLIVRKEGDFALFLNNVRHQTDASLKMKIPLSKKDVPAVMAIDGIRGVVEGVDYRGVPVLADIQVVPKSNWLMISKVDRKEVYAYWTQRSRLILLLMCATILALIVTGGVIRQRNDKLHAQSLLLTEKALGVSEQRHLTTLLSVGDGVITTDARGCVQLLNPVAESLTGWSQEDAEGKSLGEVFNIVNEFTRQRAIDPVEQVLAEGKIVEFAGHTLLISKSGKECPIADSGAPIYGEDGVLNGVVLVFRDQTKKREAQVLLVENEKQLEATFNQAAVGIAHVAPDGRWLRVNQRLCDIVGYSQEEMLERRFQDIIHPDDLPQSLDLVDKFLARQIDTCSLEKRYIRKTGEFVWVNLTASIVNKNIDEPDYCVAIIEDISGRKKALEKLEESRWFAQGTLDALSANIAVIDYEGVIVATNSSWREFSRTNHGTEEQTNEGVNYLDICEKVIGQEQEMSAEISGGIRRMISGGCEKYINEYPCHDGQEKQWFQIRVSKFSRMEFPLLVVSHLNITDRKRAEEALRKSEKLYRVLAENSVDCIWTMDMTTCFTYVNPSILEMFGYTQDEWVGSKVCEHANQENLDILMRIIDQELEKIPNPSGFIFEATMFHKDGSVVPIEVIGNLILDEKNRPYGLQGVTRNIAKRLELESKLLQSQKMEAVGKLAGGIAHDFNNMLQTILGFTSLAIDLSEPDSIQSSHLLHVQDAATRSADLTRQLLAFARKQPIAPRLLDLNEMISGMINMLSRLIGEDIKLTWKPFSDLPSVMIDPSQLDQILANLVVNARDAIAGVGEINIETGVDVFDEEYCHHDVGFKPGHYVVLSIKDSGIGMDRETQSHIFDPFFTTKEQGKGTGLGLSTIYGIVKQNNGFVNVYSELKHGTIFRLYFPAYHGKSHIVEPPVHSSTIQKGHETILFVEDEESLMALGKMQLENLGYHVVASTSPIEAIMLASDYSDSIHLLITDVVMPELSGRELSQKLMEQHPTLKCLYMSGYTEDIIASQGVLDEGIFFLQKPFTVQNLARKVREVLE